MPRSSAGSARFRLIEIAESRWLGLWWAGLHGLIGLGVLLVELPLPGVAAGLVAVAWHYRHRFPRGRRLLLVDGDRRFALPADSRFNLRLLSDSAAGRLWITLVFSDRPGQGLLVLRDQLPAREWRLLRLMVLEPA